MDKSKDTDQTPSFEEFQKEFSKFLKEKYGGKGFVFPQADVFKTQEDTFKEKKTSREVHFDLKPKEVKAYLDRFVIQQDEAKKVLAVAVCDHYHHVASCKGKENSNCGAYSKQNVLLIGPTGVGKTYLVRMIADLIGVPFIKSDATKFSETGYVGGDVEDLVRDLVHKADGDIDLAQYGIIYLDEADKIAAPSNIVGRDVSGQGVQRGLLKLMEETEVPLKSSTDLTSQIQAVMEFQTKGKIERKTINTRHILFIMSGAFDGVSEIIRKRLNTRSIGFSQNSTFVKEDSDLQRKATTRDFVKFGFDPEFVGRLPVRVVLNELSEEDLYKILKSSEDSIVKQYVADFKSYGIEAIFSDDALKAIAHKAALEKTGARGLFTVCEKVLRDFKYELPSTGIKRFVITPSLIDDPSLELQRMLKNPDYVDQEFVALQIQSFEKDFLSKHDVKVRLDDSAKDWITKTYHQGSVSVEQLCRERLKNYEYGLTLIRQNSGKEDFVITAEVLNHPKEMLDQWIQESYSGKKKRSAKVDRD
jgi:endopeptidase Clp ATP-binding regulatory subunit ClpX